MAAQVAFCHLSSDFPPFFGMLVCLSPSVLYSDVMVAGGTEGALSPLSLSGFCRMKALSTRYNEAPHLVCVSLEDFELQLIRILLGIPSI